MRSDRTYKNTVILCLLFILAFIFAVSSCQEPSAWYPLGEASVVSSYELTTGGVKACKITLKIANTGKSSINDYSVSLAAATDIRTYYMTVSESQTILPGKNIYVSVEIPYAMATEVVVAAGVSLVDQQYR